jgi:hypothetical protein
MNKEASSIKKVSPVKLSSERFPLGNKPKRRLRTSKARPAAELHKRRQKVSLEKFQDQGRAFL